MIVRSTGAKVVSLLLSVGLLTGAMQMASPDTKLQMEGGGEPVESQMGTMFEDMAVGTLTAMTAQEVVTSEPPQETEPTQATPTQAETAQATPPTQSEAVEATPVAPMAAVPLATPLAAKSPSVALPLVASPRVEAAQPAPEPETITAAEPDSDAPMLSRRPARKNPELAAKAAQAQEEAARAARAAAVAAEQARKPKRTEQKATRGNAKKNNTRGTTAGTRKKATTQQTGKKPAARRQAGDAAASNYPGQVMRRISRLSRPRVNARGTAVIAFSISSGGGLSGVSVARSSGSAALDQAAVKLVRRAAPFPRPPAGARRQFSISIKGR
ncbi:TonB family protein [Sulfitobacter sp. F26169L]|uniref:energy transducer TonB family protein n=1 Tax=Sulfitobacter sp. F26169L TaxID=2996015 RepID=UPI002260BA55|nr:TonB family protein [Sulfitobacter sp. F26169L]MCX7567415.1 TonB family protein [Sulfitobacter sp. F26169L]